jgi:DNA-binding transcriptional regulator GbsR (MarR family)
MNTDAITLVRLAQKIGLTEGGANAYAVLLSRGPLLAKELADTLNCSEEDVLGAIDLPIAIGLVARTRRKNRQLFYATNPDFAFLSLTAHLVWRSKASLAPIRELPPTDSPNIERTRKLYSEIADIARHLYTPQGSADMHKEFDAETAEDLAQLTCETISAAATRIRALSRTPRLPHVSTFWTAITDRIAAGVTYTRIADLPEFIDHGLLIKQRDMMETGVDLFMLETEQIAQSFYVIDNRYLSTTHKKNDPASPYRGIGRITTERRIIDRYRKRFDKLLAAAIPGQFVIGEMRHASDALMKAAQNVLDTDELPWIQSLVDWGEFSTFTKDAGWARDRTAELQERAIRAGLVRLNQSGRLIPVYRVDEEQIRTAYGRRSSS